MGPGRPRPEGDDLLRLRLIPSGAGPSGCVAASETARGILAPCGAATDRTRCKMDSVIFEVVCDKITDVIGEGIALPRGEYPGVIEWRTTSLVGNVQPYLHMAGLFLRADQQETLGVANPRDVWCTIHAHVKSGKIIAHYPLSGSRSGAGQASAAPLPVRV